MNKWEILPIPDGMGAPLIMRLNALGSLYFFEKFVLQRNRLVEHFHKPICESLERQNVYFLLEVPRDHFKTSMVTEGLPMWRALPFDERDEAAMRELGYDGEWIRWMKWAHNPGIRILTVSETMPNAARMGRRIDKHFENNIRFRDLFPEIQPTEKSIWNSESKCVTSDVFHSNGEGTFDYLGVGGALQSRHYDFVIEDDIVGKDAMKSDLVMSDTIDYHKLMEGAFDGPEHSQIVVGNRWSPFDLNGWIRDNDPDFVIESHSALGGCCDMHPAGYPIFPEEFTIERLERIRRVEGPIFFCLPDEAPILMSDWSEKPIVDVQVGDEVVGFAVEGYSHLVKAKVTAKCEQLMPVVKVTLDSGRQVICTPEHKWFIANSGHRKRTKSPYLPARIGKKMVSVCHCAAPNSLNEQRDLDWLGGILDGEGSVNGCVFVSQSPEVNPIVCSELQHVCARLGMELKGTHPHNSWYIKGGRNLKVRLIRHAKMAKNQRFINYLWKHSKRIMEEGGEERVVSIEPCGTARVWGIETTSGNYVAYGFASANSHQYLNQPLMADEIVFNKDWLRWYAPAEPDKVGKPMMLTHEVREGEVIGDISPKSLHRIMIVDPNHAGAHGRARHAIIVVGYHQGAGRITNKFNNTDTIDPDRMYLLDVWAHSMNYEDLLANIWRMAEKWQMKEFWLETVAAQKYLKAYIEYRNKIEKRYLRVRELKTERTKNAKWDRIDALAPAFEQGRFYVRRDQSAFLDEFYRYSHSTRYPVDVLDCCGYSLQVLEPMFNRSLAEQQKSRKEKMMGAKRNVAGY